MEKVEIKTRQGIVAGKRNGRYIEFKGIPYGKAKRFEKARMFGWEGVKECIEFGKKAPQIINLSIPGAVNEPDDHFSEDCLNLNIYTPDVEASLPVLVDIHGGSFQTGSNQIHTPEIVIEDKNFVYVNLNYRLGVFGYLCLGRELGEGYRTSGNNGTADQLLALKWIHENIAFFGGNPNQMTLLGSSAGAKAIGVLMLFKESRNYFSQVLLSSGACQSIRNVDTAEEITRRYLEILGVTDPQELLTMDRETLLEGQKELCKGAGSTCIFGPVADGVLIPKNWEKVLDSKDYWSGRAIVGSSRNELAFYKEFDLNFLSDAPIMAEELFGMNASIAKEEYQELCNQQVQQTGSCDDEMKKDLWVKILSDYMYRTYSERLAKTLAHHGSTVYLFSMEYAPAVHCMDQTFSFDSRDGGTMFQDESTKEERQLLRNVIYEAYTNFVLTGNPNGQGIPDWPVFREDERYRMEWNTLSQARMAAADDVLDRFPNYVYRLK